MELLLELLVWWQTFNDVQNLDFVAAWEPAPKQVCRRAGNAKAMGYSDLVANPCNVPSPGEALLEGRGIQPELLGVALKLVGSESLLVFKQKVMHVPELLLVASACGCLCGLEGVLMPRKRQVEIDELDLSGANELLLDLR